MFSRILSVFVLATMLVACSSSDSDTPPPPGIEGSLSAEFTFLSSGLVVNFEDTSVATDTTISSWSWNFGDTISSEEQNPSHTYSESGSYTVTLTVADSNGITNTISKDVDVKLSKIFSSNISQSTFSISADGKVYAWGNNGIGQLGLGAGEVGTEKSIPTEVTALKGIKEIVAGSLHTFAIADNGTVYSWGDNFYGQLGLGNNDNMYTPTEVTALKGIKTIVGGGRHTVALADNGTVYTWGYNHDGQLGLGATGSKDTPTEVTALKGIKEIVAGYYHTVALADDGTVYSWGDNFYGQLGLGDSGIGTEKSIPTEVTALKGIKEIVAGFYYTVALADNGTVYTWGENTEGQLGLGDSGNGTEKSIPTEVTALKGIKTIVGGGGHTFAIADNGTVYSWGNNGSGQLGLGNAGSVTEKSIPTEVTALKGIKEIVAGYYHTVAIADNGTVYTWGDNAFGQLGFGDTTDRETPVVNPNIK